MRILVPGATGDAHRPGDCTADGLGTRTGRTLGYRIPHISSRQGGGSMFSNAVRALVVAGLLGVGWVAGHAQAPTQAPTQAPPPAPSVSSDFELLVTTGTGGETEVTCVRGCKLTWA